MDLAGTRDVGMAVGPISYREIRAYNSETLACLRAWDVKLIRRLDTAVRTILSGGASADRTVPASNGRGVAAIFRGLARKPKPSGEPNV